MIVAPSFDILGGHSTQAAALCELLGGEEGIEVSLLAINPRLPGVLRRLQSIKYLRTLVTSALYLAQLLRRTREHDVIHIFAAAHTSFLIAATPAILIARLMRKTTILHYHSGEADLHLRRRRRTAPRTMRLADAIVVPSRFSAEQFAAHDITTRLIPNVVVLDRFPFRERRPHKPVFLSNRRLEADSNVACVLRALALVQERHPNARLIVAGDGPERPALEALARELGLRGTRFVGWVAPGRAAELYGSADIYLNGSAEPDNVPISILEAFASGLPVVSTDVSGIPELVEAGETGLLIGGNDHRRLAASALALLDDPALAARIATNARRACSRFSWPAVREQWLELYGMSAGATTGTDVVFYAPSATALLAADGRPAAGGAERQVLLLARELAARGHSVAIVAFGDPGNLLGSVDGVRVIEHPRPATKLPLLRTLAFYRDAFATLRSSRPRVVVQRAAGVHTLVAALSARALDARFVYASAGMHDFDLRGWERRRWVRSAFALGVRLADVVVVQTPEQEKLCRARFGCEPELIASIAEPRAARVAEPDAFLWIGAVTAHKQPLSYVELARAVPEARFRMVAVPSGDAVCERELAAAAGGVANLELLGPQPRAQLTALVERAVAIVSTSRSEGMPNVFLEGFSQGVPALALAHDPDGLLERERLGGFARGSPAALAELSSAAWRDRLDQREAAARCRAYVERDHAAARIADRWRRVLALSDGGDRRR
jgi:glycosyltransferase involved in cell wall biosynthesis